MGPEGGRQRFLRYLLGKGLEVGPGHAPFVAATPAVRVRYVDRWEPDENRELFPELEGQMFSRPDLVRDLNQELLAGVPSASEDFVVASHLLEHLANPIRVLDEFHRVLRPGGVLVILLPDRRFTFDKGRPGTPLGHLVEEFRTGVSEVDEEHLLEFLYHVCDDVEILKDSDENRSSREAVLDLHRKRSIHVHCWVLEEFADVIAFTIEELGQSWEFVDGLAAYEDDPSSEEFGLVLRRTSADLDAGDLGRHFRDAFSTWFSDDRARRAELESARSRLHAAEERARALDAVYSTRTFRYSRIPRRIYAHMRNLKG